MALLEEKATLLELKDAWEVEETAYFKPTWKSRITERCRHLKLSAVLFCLLLISLAFNLLLWKLKLLLPTPSRTSKVDTSKFLVISVAFLKHGL